MLSHAYNILIDFGVGATGHGKYFVDGLNATDKRFIAILIQQLYKLLVHNLMTNIWSFMPQ